MSKERLRFLISVIVISLAFWGISSEVRKVEATARKLTHYVNENCQRQEKSRKFQDLLIDTKTQILPFQGKDKTLPLNKSIKTFNNGQEKAKKKLKKKEPKISSRCKDILK